MAITLLQLAEKILEEEKRALLSHEIWQIAKKEEIDKLVFSTGKTPGAFLGTLIDADIRDSPSSIFSSLGTQSKRFFLKSQIEIIHDKVRIIEHAIYAIDHGVGAYAVVATKDSLGTKLYYEEYCDEINGPVKHGIDANLDHLAWVKSGVNEGTRYPVRFDEVVPLSDEDYAKISREGYLHIDVRCQVGATTIVPSESFVVL
jgi:hypothetical protein